MAVEEKAAPSLVACAHLLHRLAAGPTPKHPRSTSTMAPSSNGRSPPPGVLLACVAVPAPQQLIAMGCVPPASPPGLRKRPTSLRRANGVLLGGTQKQPLDLQVEMKVYGVVVSTNYKIKDVAERSGFSAATLRYYEEIGLLPESTRTPAGYRMYDDRTLRRLAFISRAKHLGCSLDEIADLTVVWDGGRCGPVQDRLRTVVADKIASAQQQIVELMTLTSDLQQAAATLETHRPDGPCDDRCGCVNDTSMIDTAQLVTLGTKPEGVAGEMSTACTLGSQAMQSRLDEWQRLLEHVEDREAIEGGLRATLAPATPLTELTRLIAAEQECCQFLAFAITIDSRGVALEVRSPLDALPVLHSLLGRPT